MAALDVVGAQLQKHIEGLHETVQLTIAQGEHARSAVDAARARIEEHYAQVETRAVALRTAVEERRQHVETTLQTFYDAAHQLGDDSVAAREQISGFLHEAGQDLQALHEHVEGELQPALDEVLQHAKSVHESVGERLTSMQDEIGSVVDDSHDLLAVDTPHHLAEVKAQVDQAHEEVRSLIQDHLMPQIQQQVEACQGRLDELHAHLQDRIASSSATLHEGAASSLHEMMTQFTQHSDAAQQFAQQVDGVMGTLKEAIDTGGTVVADGKQVVETGVDTTSAGLKAVVDTLDELKDFFSRFSFVQI